MANEKAVDFEIENITQVKTELMHASALSRTDQATLVFAEIINSMRAKHNKTPQEVMAFTKEMHLQLVKAISNGGRRGSGNNNNNKWNGGSGGKSKAQVSTVKTSALD